MKKIAGIVALAFAAILTSCGGADSDTSAFVGKIEFKASGMGMNTNGSMTMDAENERFTYRIDALQQFMGMDMATMVDFKKKMTYMISPSKGIYMEMPMEEGNLEKELPNKKEVDEMKKDFFSKLKKTGKTQDINGYKCEEYVLKEKVDQLESASIWVNKNLLDRMTSNLEMMEELKKLGAEDLMIGFPMKATFTADGKSGSFEITKITEGKDVLADFDLSKMKKLSQMEFTSKLMEGSAMENLMNGFGDMEKEGMFDDMDLENMDLEKSAKDLEKSAKELEKMLEGMK